MNREIGMKRGSIMIEQHLIRISMHEKGEEK